jgi:Mycobacterium membrane protein
VAQGDSDSLGCRITIDGVVKDERSVNTVNAYTFRLDKSG